MTQLITMHKLILCTIVSIFISTLKVNAQGNSIEVIYLKNGSIIHGMIIELIPNESVKIRTNGNDVIYFKMDEVQKISREEITESKVGRLTDDKVKTHGYLHILELNYANGNDVSDVSDYYATDRPSLGFSIITDYQFNPYLSAGIGFGIQGFDDMGLVPFFADVRYYVVKGTMTPFVSFDAGYSISFDQVINPDEDYFRGGIFSSLSIGMKFFTQEARAIGFSFGYNYQGVEYYGYLKDPSISPHEQWIDAAIENMALKFSFVF